MSSESGSELDELKVLIRNLEKRVAELESRQDALKTIEPMAAPDTMADTDFTAVEDAPPADEGLERISDILSRVVQQAKSNAASGTNETGATSEPAKNEAVASNKNDDSRISTGADGGRSADVPPSLGTKSQKTNSQSPAGTGAHDAKSTEDNNSAGNLDGEPSSKSMHVPPPETNSSQSAKSESKPRTESLESRIGLYWLSKLGTGFLVVGVALLIMYSFQYFGPWHKLGIGYLVSAILLGLGEWMERKNSTPWFSRALAGGGWSLAYFTTYATHHIQSVRVIDDPAVNFLMMLAVAGLTVWHSILRKSEMMATLAIMLGFLTIALSPVGVSSAIACVLLTATMSTLVVKMRWHNLNRIGMVTAYSTFCSHLSDFRYDLSSLSLLSSYLVTYWLAQHVIALSIAKRGDIDQRELVAVNTINTLAFSSLWLPHIYKTLPDTANFFLLGLAAVYSVFAFLCEHSKLPSLARLNSLTALSLATAYIPASMGRNWSVMAWSAELPLLVWAGLTYNLRSFRWFSVPLAFCLVGAAAIEWFSGDAVQMGGLSVPWNLFSGLACLGGLLVACVFQRAPKFKESQGRIERGISFYTYSTLASFMAFWLPGVALLSTETGLRPLSSDVRQTSLLLIWAVEAYALTYFGLKTKDLYLLAIATFWMLALGACSLGSDGAMLFAPVLAVGTIYGAAATARLQPESQSARVISCFWYCLASLFAFMLIPQKAGASCHVPALWAVQAVGSLLVGFRWNEPVVRWSTLAMLLGTVVLMPYVAPGVWDVGAVVVLMYIAAGIYRHNSAKVTSQPEAALMHCYNVGGTYVLTSQLMRLLESGWLTSALAVEGLALLSLGFVVRDKVLRVCGLLVFGVLVAKLLFVDLAAADTIQRIIAFIVAGVILLLSSFGYSWFSKKMTVEEPSA